MPNRATRSSAPREGALDILKLVLAVMVVGLHGRFLQDVNRDLSTLAVQGLFRVAVPCFFVISGLFLERMAPAQFGRWLWRLVVIYLIWTAAYAGFWLGKEGLSATEAARLVLFGYEHLWFLPALGLSGLLLHALRHQRTPVLFGLALAAYAAGLLLQYAGSYHLITDPTLDRWLNRIWVYRNFLFFGLPFLTLGFLLSRHEGRLAVRRTTLFRAATVGLALLLAESWINRLHTGQSESFDLLFILPVLCPLVVLWTQSFAVGTDTRGLAQLATGIYLVHPVLLGQLGALTGLTQTPVVLAAAALSAALSFTALQASRGIPCIGRMHAALFAFPPKVRAARALPQEASR